MIHEHPKCNTCQHCKAKDRLGYFDGKDQSIRYYECYYHEEFIIETPDGQYCSEHTPYGEDWKGGKHEAA